MSCKALAFLAMLAVSAEAAWEPKQVRLAKEFLSTLDDKLVTNTTGALDAIAPYVTPDWTTEALPTTLRLYGDNQTALLMLFFIDPLVEFKITITDWTAKRTRDGMKVNLEGYSRGLTTAGLAYANEYRFSFYFNHEKKITKFVEFLDSFAVACFLGMVPADVCAANGLQGRPGGPITIV